MIQRAEDDEVQGYETNIQLVTRLMEFSSAGALMQAFVIDALLVHAKNTVAAPDWEGGVSQFINQDAWRKCARECIEQIENRR